MAETPVVRKPLTHVRQAETAKPEDAPYSLNVGDGLFLEIMPTGTKRWRFRYSHAEKRKLLSMGLFPDIGLQQAKEARDSARKLVAQGIDPSDKRREDKEAVRVALANSFEAVAKEWMERQDGKAR